MKRILFLSLLLVVVLATQAQQQKTDTEWFEDAKFGMFIHFGPYSVLGAGEWVMNNRPIKANNYLCLQDFFNPQEFDAAEWVSLAKKAGMRYIVITSRHHDSFSNWDTKASDWNIMHTPYGKDLLKQLADECQKQDMKLGFYYSTLDWMRNDYQWETGRTGKGSDRPGNGDWNAYIEFMKTQLSELLTGYGPVACIWFDGHWDQTDNNNRISHATYVDWHYPEIYALIKELQPECLIGNNHHLPPLPGEDFQIFERDVPGENTAGHSGQEVSRLPLETCQTIGAAWGYNINDDNFKSTEELIRLLVRTSGMGANLLLNVGPMPNGKIIPECIDRLKEIGDWMSTYGHTLYGTTQGPLSPQSWGVTTAKESIVYIHILDPETRELTIHLPRIKSAKWINMDNEVKWKKNHKTGDVTFIFDRALNQIDSIIEVILR